MKQLIKDIFRTVWIVYKSIGILIEVAFEKKIEVQEPFKR